MVKGSKEGCKKAYEEGQFCSHIPDHIKERITTMEKFTKYDDGKPKRSLLPAKIFDGIFQVVSFGLKKYEKDNWKKCNHISSYYDACHRHLDNFWSGENLDKESGLHHLDHAIVNLLFTKWVLENKEYADDRPRENNVQVKKDKKKFSFFRKR